MPIETLIMLQNNLDTLPIRSKTRCFLVKEIADIHGVSTSTIRRELRKHYKIQSFSRSDYNKTRVISRMEMKRYCELIAALKIRTTNKKGHHLSTKECIRLIETYGVETPEGLVKASIGMLKRTTIERYLKRWGFDAESMRIEPPVVHFQAVCSNDCWQFDFSVSDLKKLKGEKISINSNSEPKLMLASVVDDRSGVCYQEYHYVYGEDALTALRFLFNAMATKKCKNFPFQGIPKIIYMDGGPVFKSNVFKRVMNQLGVEVRAHMPKGSDGRRTTTRSKGKVERQFRTVKSSFEPLYHFHEPETILEANTCLEHYLQRYNVMPHRLENHSRIEDWLENLPPSGFLEMCSWDRFCTFTRDSEERKVETDGCVRVNSIRYQLDTEMAGQEVTLLWGIFDNELYVEFNGKKQGPFYPAEGPIPLNTYRKPSKNDTEKRADYIEELAKNISITKSALMGENALITQSLVESSHIPPLSIPFEKANFETMAFKNKIEAKVAIAQYIGISLAKLIPEQMEEINRILTNTLDKNIVMAQVRAYFSNYIEN
ncbi:MAG: transposase family protein [Desulfobacterales bacterium]|nr:transposase family protein [Desulfobacterales bacterium]